MFFEEATTLLSGSKYITLSMVMPTFIELFTYIETVMEREDIQLDVKLAFSHSHTVLSKYYEFSDDSSFYLAAVILDPRFKAKYLIDKQFNVLYHGIVDKIIAEIRKLVSAKNPPQEKQ